MTGYENPDTIKARNARRRESINAHTALWKQDHREQVASQQRERYSKMGKFAQMIDDARDPIVFHSDNVALTCDFHVPFHNEKLLGELIDAAKANGTKDLAIDGDFLDCDNVSKFNSTTLSEETEKITFKGECIAAQGVFKQLLAHFDNIYMCQGNHEYRWCALNAGKVGMKQLMALCRPSNMSEDEFDARVHITLDDHMFMTTSKSKWMLCHPRNFRITPLSVARDLAAKYLCNIHMAHGHGFNQGRDRSGQFRVLDGGGLYERAALEYTRSATCHPMTRSGFYILKENNIIVYEGES